MNSTSLEWRRGVELLVSAIRQRVQGSPGPVVVALDGRSGSGKSTVAALVAPLVAAVIVPTDDFFAAGIPDGGWDVRTPAKRASDAIDWPRLRTEALEPLRAGRPASWRAFDFAAGVRPDGTYALQREWTVRQPGAVVLLDGAYSARAELADLVDLTVLVEASAAVRHQRLAAREAPAFLERWHARWDGAEDHYFGQVRPPETFGIVLHSE